MGKESAKTLLAAFEELASSKHSGYTSRGKCGSIIIPEGWNCSGWQGFGKELRRVIHPERETSNNSRIQLGGERLEIVAVASSLPLPQAQVQGETPVGGLLKERRLFRMGSRILRSI
ncbi:hypothetical protein FCV25MIE_09097 [Fagus crenata]